MIGVEQVPRLAQSVLAPVAERILTALQAVRYQRGVVRNAPQRENHPQALQLPHLDLQVGVAAADLLRQWLVLRRHAFDRIRDARVPQPEVIIGRLGLWPCRKTQLIEDRKSTRLNSSHDQISYAVF